MHSTTGRKLAVLITAAVFGAMLLLHGLSGWREDSAVAHPGPMAAAGDCVMFGGSPARNMVNLDVKNLAVEWDVTTRKNIKWVADLGSASWGGPVVAQGKVFVGTNNQRPRDKKHRDKGGRPIDLGVLMAFDEKTGEFLWQQV